MCKISIIIPAYNAGEFIATCLDSCLEQTFKNFEVLVINDGSSDNTVEIVQKYICQDSRIKLICKNNQGLVEARRTGISEATGEFIFFLDSDDIIDHNALYKLIKYDKYDLIIGGIVIESQNGSSNYIQHTNIMKYPPSRSGMYANYLSKNITASLCGRLIRKHLLTDLLTPSNVTIGEDVITNFLIFNSDNILVKLVPDKLYHYIQYSNSMVNKKSNSRLDKRIQYLYWIINFLKKENIINDIPIAETLPHFIISEYYTYLRDGGSPQYNPDFYTEIISPYWDTKVINKFPFWQRQMVKSYHLSTTLGNFYRFLFMGARSMLK